MLKDKISRLSRILRYWLLASVILIDTERLEAADELVAKRNDLTSALSELNQAESLEATLQKTKENALHFGVMIDDVSSTIRTLSIRNRTMVAQFRQKLTALKQAIEADNQELGVIAEWLRPRMAMIMTTPKAIELQKMREEYLDYRSKVKVCQSPRAQEIGEQLHNKMGQSMRILMQDLLDAQRLLGRLPDQYAVFRDGAKSKITELLYQQELAYRASLSLPTLGNIPTVCREFQGLEMMMVLASTLADMRQTSSELQGLDLEKVMRDLDNEQAAADYLTTCRRMINQYFYLFSSYLAAFEIDKASSLANHMGPAFQLLLEAVDRSPLIDEPSKYALRALAQNTKMKILAAAQKSLATTEDLRKLLITKTESLFVQAKTLKSTGISLHTSNWANFETLLQTRLKMNLSEESFFLPAFASKQELLEYDLEVDRGRILLAALK